MKIGTSFKTFLGAVMGGMIVLAALLWFDDRPNELVWILRGVTTVCAVGLLLAIFYLDRRKDQAPDYLRQLMDKYFNCDGFAFVPGAVNLRGVCWITLTFQNQRNQPCIGRVRLRPARGLWLKRNQISDIVFEVFCKPAAFGVARIPIELAPEYQGTSQSFDFGASVEHLESKGDLVRFWDGLAPQLNEELRRSTFLKVITCNGLLMGHFEMLMPRTVTIPLPKGVLPELPTNVTQDVVTLWQLGDPPLRNDWRLQFR